jgi:hypothetical protein
VLQEKKGDLHNMKHSSVRRTILIAIAAVMSMILSTGVCFGSVSKPAGIEIPAKLPKLDQPVLITSIGQAPGASWAKVLMKQLKIDVTHDDMVTAEDLVKASKNPKTAYKTLIMSMGTSLKGMGGAGVDIDKEVARCNALADQAKKLGMTIVGIQIEGSARRTDESDEKSNRAVTSKSDILIVRKEVDKDGFFTNAAKQKGIPIIRTVESMDFKYAFSVLFR